MQVGKAALIQNINVIASLTSHIRAMAFNHDGVSLARSVLYVRWRT